MKRFLAVIAILALVMAFVGSSIAAAASQPTELRFVWFTDGPDLKAIEHLIAQFNQKNPDIRVRLTLMPYGQLNQLLQAQATAGNAPDLARVSEPPRFYQYALDLRPYLSDPTLPKQFIPQAMKLMTGPKGEVYGIPHDFTLNGPFVNVTLFKKAGVPLPQGERVSWETWAKLAAKVRDATGVPFAMAVDRSGHRLDGFIQSYGGGFFTPDGKSNITAPETKAGIEAFVRLHRDGIMPLEVWAGGGQGYAAANQLFVNGQLPFYLSGNWQVAQFHEAIGGKFEWKAVLNGFETEFGGMPGGKFVMAFKDTKAPDKVARLLEFLGSKEAMRQYAQEALFLPTRNDLIKEGIKYPTENEVMNIFLKGIQRLPSAAYVDNYNNYFGPVANEVRDRVTQAILGETSVGEAIGRTDQKTKEILEGK